MSELFRVKDIDISQVVTRLEMLLGKEWIKQRIKEYKHISNPYDPNKHNFWAPYFNDFYKWKETRKLLVYIPVPPKVAELANWSLTISIFEKDWNEQKHLFLTRLRKNDSVKHLLFELIIGLHYFFLGYVPTLVLDNQGGRKPDLILHYNRTLEVYVECVRRMGKLQRSSDISVLVEDLICTLRDKKESKVDWGGPRIVAIHVPEEIDWKDEGLRKNLGRRINAEFETHEQDYQNVNIVIFSSDRILKEIGDVSSTDIPSLFFTNRGKTRYRLPYDFRVAGK
jgi:hypothetical protein